MATKASKPANKQQAKPKAKAKPQTNPFADMFETFTKSMPQFPAAGLPGFDMDSAVKAGQANLEAIKEAGRITVEGVQTLAKRQQEMLTEAVSALQDSAKDLTSGNATDAMPNPLEAARKGLETSVANARELAEIASKSQTEAWSVLGQRWQDNVADLRKSAS